MLNLMNLDHTQVPWQWKHFSTLWKGWAVKEGHVIRSQKPVSRKVKVEVSAHANEQTQPVEQIVPVAEWTLHTWYIDKFTQWEIQDDTANLQLTQACHPPKCFQSNEICTKVWSSQVWKQEDYLWQRSQTCRGTYSRRVAGSSPVLISETTVCSETIDCDETHFKWSNVQKLEFRWQEFVHSLQTHITVLSNMSPKP
jgi:hypothetical protein